MNTLFPELENPQEKNLEQETILKPEDNRYKTLGQFFTPEPTAQFMASIAKELFSRGSEENVIKVLDPSAGEGALLSPLSEIPVFATYGVEIDPKNIKELKKNAHFAFLGDGVSVMTELYLNSVFPDSLSFLPVDLFLMNPPYNLQLTVPENVSHFLCVRKDLKTGRLTAISHEFFFEAAVRIIAQIGSQRYSIYPPALISLHSEHHLSFIRKLYEKIKENFDIQMYILPVGKAYNSLPYNFYIVLVFMAEFSSPDEPIYLENEIEVLKLARRLAFPPYRLTSEYSYGDKTPVSEKTANFIKAVISMDALDLELTADEVIPKIYLKNGKIVLENPGVLEILSRLKEITHPLTDESITIPTAIESELMAKEMASDPLVGAYFLVKPEQVPAPVGLKSLSPPTPLQYVAFVKEGFYKAEEDLIGEDGKAIIEKGKTYYLRSIIKETKHTRKDKETSIDKETGEEKETTITKVHKYKTKVVQVINQEKNKVILEVEV